MSLAGDDLFKARMRISKRRWPHGSAAKWRLPRTGDQMNFFSATNRDLLVCKSRLCPSECTAAPSSRTAVTSLLGLLALAMLSMARPVAAATAYVQGADQDPFASNALSVKYTAAQNAGDLNVVAIGWNDSTSSVVSVTDSNHNTYLVAATATASTGNGTQVIYYAQNIAAAAAGANTVTVTFSTTVPWPDVRIVEYSGIASSSALDVSVGASGTSISPSSGAVATTNPNDLLVGANYIGAGFAAVGSGYTQRLVTNPDDDLVEDRTVTATGSYGASSTENISSWWVMQMAAFRAAGSGGSSSSSSSSGGGSSSGSSSSGSSSSSSSSGSSSSSSSGGSSSSSGSSTSSGGSSSGGSSSSSGSSTSSGGSVGARQLE